MYAHTDYLQAHDTRPGETASPELIARRIKTGNFTEVSINDLMTLAAEIHDRTGRSPRDNAQARTDMLNWLYDEIREMTPDPATSNTRWNLVTLVYLRFPVETKAELELHIDCHAEAFAQAIADEAEPTWGECVTEYSDRHHLPAWAAFTFEWKYQ